MAEEEELPEEEATLQEEGEEKDGEVYQATPHKATSGHCKQDVVERGNSPQ